MAMLLRERKPRSNFTIGTLRSMKQRALTLKGCRPIHWEYYRDCFGEATAIYSP